MPNHREIATRLSAALKLSLSPVGLAFPDEVPEGVPDFDGAVPAGCVFWQEAARRTFSTSTRDHALCSIGVHTHNMAQPDALHGDELAATLEAMSGLDYVHEDEVAAIPVLRRTVRHAIYGPLAEFPVDPDVVIVFAHARQGLVLSEAVARVDGGAPPAMGRPACAVVPRVMNGGRAAMSLGCCGARAYLSALSDDTALWALPGPTLATYCDQIDVLARANDTLGRFHARRGADIVAGVRPTVRESLARLSQ